MQYSIEYYTTANGSMMTMDAFNAGSADEARRIARDLLADFAKGHEADYALYWTGDEDAEMVQL